jgi:hypothetical protein
MSAKLPDGWTVTLEQHVGQKRAYDSGGNVIGMVPVTIPQKRIRVDTPERKEQGLAPFLFGLVCDKPGTPINVLATLPDEVVESIAEEVRRQLGQNRPLSTPVGFENALPPDDEDEDDEDESGEAE